MADDIDLDADDDTGESGDGDWIVTFADMVTLLLVFFILLLSMSTLEKQKYEETFSSVRETFGGAQMLNVQSEIEAVRDMSAMKESASIQQQQQMIIEAQNRTFNEIRSYISQKAEISEVSAKFDNGVITLTIPADVLFAAGSEEVLPQAQPFLQSLREVFLKERQQNINIKGYTDNSPLPAGARFKDNWELSALRAVNILKEMLKGGIEPVRLTATGLADLEPVAPNTTEENKAKNRRVEFVLERRVGEY